MAKSILVTGAAGFIGSNFVRWWLERHPDDHLVALDKLTYAGDPRNLAGLGVRLAICDICDLSPTQRLLAEEEIDTVVNFAAESHNSLAVVDPGALLPHQRPRHTGTARGLPPAWGVALPSRLDVRGLRRPTARLGGGVHRGVAVPAADALNASKAAADHAVRAYFETFGLPVTITSCSNNYGPRQFPEKVIPLFVTNALDDRELPLYASTQNRREWLHVDDHCRAIELVLEQGREGETYNVGSGVERTIEEIADLALELTGKPESLKTIVPDRPGHDRRYLLDSTRLRRELGWEPAISFEDGLRTSVDWYAANRDWWEPLRERAPVRELTQWT